VVTGTLKSGSASSLSADDGSYYVVSTTNASALWSASFTGVPGGLTSLSVTYNGKAGSACTQNVNLWNWYYNAWVSISRTTATTSDSTMSVAAPGLLSDYVFMGEVRASLQCFRTDGAAFDVSSDLLKISYS
jgi:hypothetical protein